MSDADQYFDNWTRTIVERDTWKKRALEAESSKGTIHVAPCSCELHVEIRRLEAELAGEKQLTEAAWRGHAILTARAEKAEKRAEAAESEIRRMLLRVE